VSLALLNSGLEIGMDVTMKGGFLPIGLIGLGSIGSFVARAIMKGEVEGTTLVAAADPVRPRQDFLDELQSHSVTVVGSFSALLEFPIRLVVECANQKVVQMCASSFLSRGIDLLIMSVGALVQGSIYSDLEAKASKNGCRIYIPSGAIGGIDALKAARLSGLEDVTLTTRKPPRSLGRIEGVDLDHLIEPLVVYEGKATEAVAKFPQNVNVAATVSLAGVGPEKTRVRVIADPAIDRNIHEIQARGAFGSFSIRLSNNPSPDNPKTSLLACLSVLSLLKSIQGTVQLGT
jgi:aspartate dehydrogenase